MWMIPVAVRSCAPAGPGPLIRWAVIPCLPAEYPQVDRQARWQSLADWTPALRETLNAMTQDLALDEVPAILQTMLSGQSRGRYRVDLTPLHGDVSANPS